MSITILLVDDHQIVRSGLRSLLESEPGIKVVGEVATGRDAVQQALKLLPDVVLMDINMPDMNGAEATRQIVAEAPEVKVIGLSMYSDKRFVARMLKAGASGYLLKECSPRELVQAIESVMEGQTFLSPGIVDLVLDDYVRYLNQFDSSDSSVLTARETEVLQLIAEGVSTKDIASRLHISVKTVETHRRQIMEKLDAKSVAQLIKFAIREGFTSVEG